MADVEVKYRGQTIRAMSASGTEVLHTEGKLCDDDITIDYTSPGGGANLQTKSVSYTPDETGISDTILPDPGYDGMDEVDVTVDAIPDTYVGSAIPQRDSSDLLVTGRLVRAPAGYYASLAGAQVAMGTEGTPTASKGAVSNHSVDVMPSVTNVAGYINGGTQTGTPVTVSASELVSGSQTVTVNDTYDVTNLAEMVVNVSGGGVTVLSSGTFTGGGSYAYNVNIGTKAALKNSMLIFWADGEDDFPYDTKYKPFCGGILCDSDLCSYVYESTQGTYDRYYPTPARSYTVDNSGTITTLNPFSLIGSDATIRNNAFGNLIAIVNGADKTHMRKYSDHWTYYCNLSNSNYQYPTAITYNWKYIYYGSDPSNDIIEIV